MHACRLHSTQLSLLMIVASIMISALVSSGCSTTKSVVATEQLLMSDAVDRAVADIDFHPLAGRKIYLDTQYLIQNRNPLQLINTDYVVSSMRQQMVAAGCMLVPNRDEAELIAEARIGALGTDNQLITYGLPESSALSRAASALANAPAVPSVPEIAIARRDHKSAAAKLAIFAYDKKSLEPVWQSGISQSDSTALDTWVMGVGPFRRGTIQDAAKLSANNRSLRRRSSDQGTAPDENPLVDYSSQNLFALSHYSELRETQEADTEKNPEDKSDKTAATDPEKTAVKTADGATGKSPVTQASTTSEKAKDPSEIIQASHPEKKP